MPVAIKIFISLLYNRENVEKKTPQRESNIIPGKLGFNQLSCLFFHLYFFIMRQGSHRVNCIRNGVWVSGLAKDAGLLVTEKIRNSSHRCRNNRNFRGHGFQEYIAESFGQARPAKKIPNHK